VSSSDVSDIKAPKREFHLNVADEAHKATGNHSYVQCISYLMANHPHFRVVALTATPGRTPEKVQEIVDNLHISHIEIREAEAPEISRYMYKKVSHGGHAKLDRAHLSLFDRTFIVTEYG
jgi:ATP-dependent DNA helicase MPH1